MTPEQLELWLIEVDEMFDEARFDARHKQANAVDAHRQARIPYFGTVTHRPYEYVRGPTAKELLG